MSTIANKERQPGLPAAGSAHRAERQQPRHPHTWLTRAFAPISLEQLNDRAALLERTDNKYIIPAAVLRQALPRLAQEFDILEINGKRLFSYETCYFDDADHSTYQSHHQGRRRRCKVRMRKYVDAGLCFVEVKLKDGRGATVKKRLAHTPGRFGRLDQQAQTFVRGAYSKLYGEALAQALEPTITMRYQRMTLVARHSGERMTLDVGLQFTAQGRTVNVGHAHYLLETKSSNGNGIADRILRALREHPVSPCSKYCIGLAALQQVDRYNRFLPALRRLGLAAPAPDPRLPPQATPALRPVAGTPEPAARKRSGPPARLPRERARLIEGNGIKPQQTTTRRRRLSFSLEALFSHKDKALHLLRDSADTTRDAAQAVALLVADEVHADAAMAQLAATRQRSKALAQQVSEALVETFVTSLEREDMEAMNAALYAIPKGAERFGERYRLVGQRLQGMDFGARIEILVGSAEVVAQMVHELCNGLRVTPMRKLRTRLLALENAGDQLMLEPYRDLYLDTRDPVRAMLAKDLFETVEQAINRCRDAGNIIYATVLKNS